MFEGQALSLPRLEEAALNSSPALQQLFYDGWLLRFAEGQTGRANSINILQPSTLPLSEKLASCEAWYAQKGLPCKFRITSVSAEPELDKGLADAGYARHDETLTLLLPLAESPPAALEPTLDFATFPLPEWLHHLHGLKGEGADAAERHLRRLQTLVPHGTFVALRVDSQVVAVGSAYVEGAFGGLFNIVTARDVRRRGYAELLVRELLRRMHQDKVQHAYLQVSADNLAALALYRKLGFGIAYRYWYRSAP